RQFAQECALWRWRATRLREGNRHRDGQVEAGPFLAQLGRREVDGESGPRILEPAVFDRRADALASLLHRGGRKTHQEELHVPSTADVRLDVNGARLEADEHAGIDASDHAPDVIGMVA